MGGKAGSFDPNDMRNRLAVIRVNKDFLLAALHLPSTAVICHARDGYIAGDIELVIEHTLLKSVPDGCSIPVTCPDVQWQPGMQCNCAQFISWGEFHDNTRG